MSARKHIARLHVRQDIIRRNIKHGEDEPAMNMQTSKGPVRGRQIVLRCDCGQEVGRLIQRMNRPLSCGARVWIETTVEACEVLQEAR